MINIPKGHIDKLKTDAFYSKLYKEIFIKISKVLWALSLLLKSALTEEPYAAVTMLGLDMIVLLKLLLRKKKKERKIIPP